MPRSWALFGVQWTVFLSLVAFFWWRSCTLLMLLVFAALWVGPGSVLRGPLKNATTHDVTPKLYCDNEDCPYELLHHLKIAIVEDILVEGLIEGSVVHFHRARTITVESSGIISASGMGCTSGLGHGNILSNGIGSGGNGGDAWYNIWGCKPACELGSGGGSGNSTYITAGGGIIAVGSLEHPLSSLSIQASVKADGENFEQVTNEGFARFDNFTGGPGRGCGGTILLFLHTLILGQ
ncbi:hypothetical protein ACSQ67_017982 [Phaseolus vulgaris]